MASSTTEWIDEITKTRMQSFYNTLSEKDQRRYAAVEAQRLGHGGIAYVAGILGCSTKTISRGIQELDSLDDDPAAGRVRRPGAGRKKTSPRAPRSSRI
jgi:hypothetical protein